MKRISLVFGVVFGLLPSLFLAPAQAAQRSAVTPWIDFELTAIASHRLNPPRASRSLAHLSRAMYLSDEQKRIADY
jgi:hypothetical protein